MINFGCVWCIHIGTKWDGVFAWNSAAPSIFDLQKTSQEGREKLIKWTAGGRRKTT